MTQTQALAILRQDYEYQAHERDRRWFSACERAHELLAPKGFKPFVIIQAVLCYA